MRERTAARLVLILGVIGVVEMVNAAKGHHLGPATIGWIAVGLVIGAASARPGRRRLGCGAMRPASPGGADRC